MAHYHAERNHQALGSKLIRPAPRNAENDGWIHSRVDSGECPTILIQQQREVRAELLATTDALATGALMRADPFGYFFCEPDESMRGGR